MLTTVLMLTPIPKRMPYVALALLAAQIALAGVGQGTAQRIVSTTPSTTEVLFAEGLQDRVVGVSNYCKYPPQALKLPKVGTYLHPNIETIARLRPDLVILQPVPGQLTERLTALHIPYLALEIYTLPDIYRAMREIGAAAGVPYRAAEAISRLKQQLHAVQVKAGSLKKQRVLLIIGRRPGTLSDLVAVGGNNYLNSLTELAGGVNVLARAGTASYPRISLETVLRENPDVIIDLTGMEETESQRSEERQQTLALWQQRRDLSAVRNHRIYSISSAAFVTPGPRASMAAEELFGYLHQDAGK